MAAHLMRAGVRAARSLRGGFGWQPLEDQGAPTIIIPNLAVLAAGSTFAAEGEGSPHSSKFVIELERR